MKVANLVGIPGLAALAIAAATGLCAQNTGSAQVGLIGTGGGANIVGMISGPAVLKGAPYSATRTTTRVQTLADGTTITHTTTDKEARDSEGRSYHARDLEMGVASGQQQFTIFTVNDPVKRITMNWTSNGKVVTVNHMPDLHPVHPTPVRQPNQVILSAQPRAPQNANPDFHVDDLGQQNINGVIAQGRRITRTIPAGSEGNDRPITTTTETWTSSELHLSVLQIIDDPRTGNSRTELSDIDRNEPDPSLFQAPDGYTVREIEPAQPQVVDTNPQ